MQFGPREAAFILLLLAMPVAAYFFVFQPRATEVAEARAEISSKQSKLKELETATKRLPDLGKEIDRLRQAIDLVEQKLPSDREVDTVLRDVSRLVTESKLTTKSFKTDKAVRSAQYVEQPIKLTIIGDFSGFYTFLQELEKLPRITRTPSMTLKKNDKEEGVMQADMVLSIFYEGEKSQASAQ